MFPPASSLWIILLNFKVNSTGRETSRQYWEGHLTRNFLWRSSERRWDVLTPLWSLFILNFWLFQKSYDFHPGMLLLIYLMIIHCCCLYFYVTRMCCIYQVLAAYYSFIGDGNFKTEEEVLALFNKKINNNPKFKVLKERVRLVK